MWKSKLIGWQDIFRFTFVQSIKSKSIRIMTFIFCTIALLSMPVAHIISTFTEDDNAESKIKTVYIIDESGLGEIDFSQIAKIDERYKNTTFLFSDKTLTEMTDELSNTETNNILLHITQNNGSYQLQLIKSKQGSVKDSELEILTGHLVESFNRSRINSLGIAEEQLSVINAPTTTDVTIISKEGTVTNVGNQNGNVETGTKEGQLNEYFLVLGTIVIVVMFFAFGGEGVASSIITEKSTRVIEFLMTSVRPMAIVVGKVLAMLTVTLSQFALMGISIVISAFINQAIFGEEMIPSSIKSMLTPEMMSSITPINIIVAILIFIAGFLFFAILAGLTGATVSKIEELAEGIMVFNMVLILGAYLGMAVAIMNLSGATNTILPYIAYLLPISTVFVTPVYMLLGKISIVWGLASLVVLLVCLILITLFTAKIYETLILHNGNKLKVKDLFAISKQSKREVI
jgi:ABC-2 type transport system permease protein